jgi:hypothetical protein
MANETETEETSRRLRRIEHDLRGNGRKGALDRITIIETEFQTIKKLLYLLIVVSVPPILQYVQQFI